MKTPEEIKRSLNVCAHADDPCDDCAYYQEDCSEGANGLYADALAYINQLEDQLHNTTKMVVPAEPTLTWNSVKDRLPEEKENVLVFIRVGKASWMNVMYLLNGTWHEPMGRTCIFPVTHWMPLHEPPKERQQAESEKSQENNRISSHSEHDIVLGCIGLIDEVLNGEFAIFEQLEADGFDFDKYKKRSECELGYSLTYFEIIQRLFLYHTTHSGGASTRAKCKELGLDPNQCVSFHRDRGDEEDDG